MTTAAIRVDASAALGFGHLTRCLALADELRAAGGQAIFLCKPGSSGLALLASRGHRVAELPPGGDDAAQTIAALDELPAPDWMIVDHYALSSDWEQAVRTRCRRLMVIDDLANRRHECDVLVDQNLSALSARRYEGLVPDACELLLGPDYALLRPEFRRARQSKSVRDGSVRRMLVFFGGGDQVGPTVSAVRAICRIPDRKFDVDVVVGPGEAALSQVQKACAGVPGIRVHANVADMAALIASADVAIGAGGVSMLERCCLGLPSLVVTLAENQESGVRAAAENGALIHLGRAEQLDEHALGTAAATFLRAPELLRHISEQGWGLVDGRGAIRVARRLAGKPIRLRPAASGDCELALEWRNAEATRAGSFDSRPISPGQHRDWFSAALSSDRRFLLIGEADDGPIGVLRYDVDGALASVSIYLAPKLHGKGLGPELLRTGDRWVRQNLPGVRQVRAEILASNGPSRAAFRSAGFGEYGEIFVKQLRT